MSGFEETGDEAVEGAHQLADRLATTQEQLRATSDILKVLTASTTGGAASRDEVFDAVVDNARRLLGAQVAQIYLVQDDSFVLARSSGLTPEFVDFVSQHPIVRDRAHAGRTRHHRPEGAPDRRTSSPTRTTVAPTSSGSAATGR